jgi:hypothetical protein
MCRLCISIALVGFCHTMAARAEAPVKGSAVSPASPAVPCSQPAKSEVPEVKILRLINTRAEQIQGALQAVLPKAVTGDGRLATFGMGSDVLILAGSPAPLKLAEAMVQELDSRPEASRHADDQVRLQVVVYEVKLPTEKIAGLNVDDLTAQARTPASLQETLSRLGPSRVIHHLDQGVDLQKETSVNIGTHSPFVQNRQAGPKGQVNSSVSYEDVGGIVKLRGQWDPRSPERGTAQINVELSTLSDSTVELSGNVKAPVFRKLRQQYDGPFVIGKPVLLLAADAQDSAGPAFAYVTRIEFRSIPLQ